MKKTKKLNILVANGVNLDLLGSREPEIYGEATLKTVEDMIRREVSNIESEFGLKIDLSFYQTNNESDFLAKVAGAWDGILLNPGAWTHTSLALADRLVGVGTAFVEVHISNTAAREDFRKHSYTAPNSSGVVYGFGIYSYLLGIRGLVQIITSN